MKARLEVFLHGQVEYVLGKAGGDRESTLNDIHRSPGKAGLQSLEVRRFGTADLMREYVHINVAVKIITTQIKPSISVGVRLGRELGRPGGEIQLIVQGTRIPFHVRSQNDVGKGS
jgi:hypothetical protein